MKKVGQVVLFQFPPTDLGKGKLRPALLLGKLPGKYDDWLICMISSQTRQYVAGFDEIVKESDKDFEQSRLKVTSVIRVGRLAVVSGEILLAKGTRTEAHEIFQDAAQRAEHPGRQHEHANSLRNIGIVDAIQGDSEKALEYLDDALARYEKLRAHHDIAVTCVEIASAHLKLGDESNAGTTLERAIALANAHGYHDVLLRISDNFPENTDFTRMAPNS